MKTQHQNRWIGRMLGALLLSPTIVQAGDLVEPSVSHLRLLGQARVGAGAIRMTDVLSFAEADPRLQTEIGTKEMIAKPAGNALEVTHDQVTDRLQALGVNMARVVVDGALACKVNIERPVANADPNGAAKQGADAEMLVRPTAGANAISLADVLRERINRDKAPTGTLEIEFELAGQQFLDLTTPPWDFAISGGGPNKLGLREFTVTVSRNGRNQRTVKIAANVRMTLPVVVAAKAISLGAFIRRDDLKFEPRIFTKDGEERIESAEQVVGLQPKRYIPAGTLFGKSDLRSVDLVQRSRPVIVSGGASVQVSLSGVAMDSGGMGETVRVRLGDAQNRREVRGVVTGVGTVRLLEDAQ